jgi:hypothetical protein
MNDSIDLFELFSLYHVIALSHSPYPQQQVRTSKTARRSRVN